MEVQTSGILKRLERKLLAADFEAAVVIVRDEVLPLFAHSPHPSVDELTNLRLRAMAAEVLDYFGGYVEARELIEEVGTQCFEILLAMEAGHQQPPSTEADRRLLKQQVWIVLHHGSTFYRHSRYEDAKRRFILCRDIAATHVTTGSYQANGTLARAYYLIGLVYRELFDYSAAKYNFTLSIDYAWKALQKSSAQRVPLADLTIAKCLGLGLAWVHYTEGRADLAIPLLLAARNLLSHSAEQVIRAYVDVVYASVQRSEKGDDPGELSDSIRLLKQAHQLFEAKQHFGYKVRAAYHLALGYIQQAQHATASSAQAQSLTDAMSFVEEMKEYSRKHGDIGFHCNALICESRIARFCGKAIVAEEHACAALEMGHERPFVRVDALIARGEARFDLGKYAGAAEDFKLAFASGKDNQKVRAALHLHLTRTFLRQNDIRRALHHFESWKELRPNVKNAFLLSLERRVTVDLNEATQDFMARWSSPNHDPLTLERKLHGFLVEWAKSRTSSDEEAAKLLKISKQTFYNWRAAAAKVNVQEAKRRTKDEDLN